MSWERAFQEEYDRLARQPAAAAPATLGEIWRAEWSASGLDTLTGVGRPAGDAWAEAVEKIGAVTGKSLGELSREAGVSFTGRGWTGRNAALREIAARLPDEQRAQVEPLLDVDARARQKARAIERESADVAARTYGFTGWGTAFAAGVARQIVDPVNLLTLPLGAGPGVGLARALATEAAIGAGVQLAQEPVIQSQREALGLEAGVGQALENAATAGVGAAGMVALLRGGAAVLRRVRAAGGQLPDNLRGVDDADLDAIALREERNVFVDDAHAAAGVDPVRGGQALNGMTRAMERGESFDVRPIEAGRPSFEDALAASGRANEFPRLMVEGEEDLGLDPAYVQLKRAYDDGMDIIAAADAIHQRMLGRMRDPRTSDFLDEEDLAFAESIWSPSPAPRAPLTENYVVPLDQRAPVVWREMNVEQALEYAPHNSLRTMTSRINEERFFADTPDMALGQGESRGVRIEFDAVAFEGRVSTDKPTWALSWSGGQAEYVARPRPDMKPWEAVRLITFDTTQPADRIWAGRMRALLDDLEKRGWSRTEVDGVVTVRRPDLSPPPALADLPLPKSLIETPDTSPRVSPSPGEAGAGRPDAGAAPEAGAGRVLPATEAPASNQLANPAPASLSDAQRDALGLPSAQREAAAEADVARTLDEAGGDLVIHMPDGSTLSARALLDDAGDDAIAAREFADCLVSIGAAP